MNKILWKPGKELVEKSNLKSFIRFLNNKYSLTLESYDDLYHWSINFSEEFWTSFWSFTDIIGEKSDIVCRNFDKMEEVEWFPGSTLNFAENLLRFRDDKTAVISIKESGERSTLSYNQMYFQVSKLSQAFRAMGIKPGDRIAGLLPNSYHAIIAMLAATSIGAIWSSTSPDFGVQGVLDRFQQIQPRILLTIDGYQYSGKKINILEKVKTIRNEISSIEQTIIIPFLAENPDITSIRSAIDWTELIDRYQEKEIRFTRFPFSHPVYVMYSSGTTGLPKSIVHGAGGTLLQHMKELKLHTDLKRKDNIFYFTTCGWMMWNWLVSSLGTGATVVLYDGSPTWPDMKRMFDLIDEENITVFGSSARFISALEKSGFIPSEEYPLSSLRTILSTGSPLAPASFDFVYEKIKADVCLSSISGGTDIISCFALGNPTGPVRRGELQVRGLGMSVEVYDRLERSVTGKKGEMVCSKPFPSMPVRFWNDEDGSRYRAAYFDKYYNIWHHGDFAEITPEGGVIIYGRSDSVLNPGGVRIGTSEIYRIVESIDEVLESICVGQDWNNDVRIILFVVLKEERVLDQSLIKKIKDLIRENATARHVPEKIIQIKEIPRTLSGKITEKAVRSAIHNQAINNKDAMSNPEALEQFRNLKELNS